MKADNNTMAYEAAPAVSELNKVAGFNPLKFVRKTERGYKLDLRYKKLWFRLKYPTGRIKLSPLRITDQLAIIEARVYFDKTDTEPKASFIAQREAKTTPGGLYIEAAQHAAIDRALSDAGFGLQFPESNSSAGMQQERTSKAEATVGTDAIVSAQIVADECYNSGAGSLQYRDYAAYGNLSLLKFADGKTPAYDDRFEIGAHPLCVCCGNPYQDRHELSCGHENFVVCKECGRTVNKSNARYADGAFYCHSCLHICAVCGEAVRGTMYPAYNRRGQLVEICQSCHEAALAPCAGCSVRSICAIIGNQLCPRAAVTAAGGAA